MKNQSLDYLSFMFIFLMVAFSIFSLDVYWYGIFYVLSFLFAYFFLFFVAKKKFFVKYNKIQNLLDNNIEDILLYCAIGVLVGGRLGQVLIYDFVYYMNSPIEILQFWKGGMSFIGGMLGVSVCMIIFSINKKINKSDFIFLLDLILIVVPFGIMFGRIGNFLNQELYGIMVPGDYWGLGQSFVILFKNLNIFYVYQNVDNIFRINTNFLASFFEGLVLFLILLKIFYGFIKKGIFKLGYISGVFLVWYSFVRFFLEYLRVDSQSEFILFFTKSQWFFVLFFVVGLSFIVFNKKKISLR